MQPLISRIQPLQIDTIQVAERSFVRGKVNKPVDVTGTKFAAKIKLERTIGVALPSGKYRVEVIIAGATGTGSYKIVDIEHGTETAPILTAAEKIEGRISGVAITVADTTGTQAGDYVEFIVEGDSTFLQPGTIMGKVTDANSPLKGNWIPVYDDTLALVGPLRILNGFVETDKTQTLAPNLREVNMSKNFATSVIVYAQINEAQCRKINLTDAMKERITGIVWE